MCLALSTRDAPAESLSGAETKSDEGQSAEANDVLFALGIVLSPSTLSFMGYVGEPFCRFVNTFLSLSNSWKESGALLVSAVPYCPLPV
jgi:hypothetical protein